METEWEGADELNEALRELRADRQAAQEELEETSQLVERAERSLDEVALDFLYRGDSVRVTVGTRSWTGIVVHVGMRVMTLQTPAGAEVDLAYEGLTSIRVVERARGGGRSRTSKHPGELIARLRELENTEEVAEVGGRHLAPVELSPTARAPPAAFSRGTGMLMERRPGAASPRARSVSRMGSPAATARLVIQRPDRTRSRVTNVGASGESAGNSVAVSMDSRTTVPAARSALVTATLMRSARSPSTAAISTKARKPESTMSPCAMLKRARSPFRRGMALTRS